MSGRAPGDNPSIRGPRDNKRIALDEPYEVKDWCAHFGITEIELRAAVRAVGHMSGDIARHLGKRS